MMTVAREVIHGIRAMRDIVVIMTTDVKIQMAEIIMMVLEVSGISSIKLIRHREFEGKEFILVTHQIREKGKVKESGRKG